MTPAIATAVVEYGLYLDESGSAKPSPQDSFKYFSMGGVLVKRNDEQSIRDKLVKFKRDWAIPSVIIHGASIRSKKDDFAFLGKLSPEDLNRFYVELTEVVTSSPLVIHACVVHREGYLNRYYAKYGANTWEMRKSALSILLERVSKYLSAIDGKARVYFEKCGKVEDRLIEQVVESMRIEGHPFDAANASKYAPLEGADVKRVIAGAQRKQNTEELIQIADICLYPVTTAKEGRRNRAYDNLRPKLIDSLVKADDLEQLGVKYYCFDKKP